MRLDVIKAVWGSQRGFVFVPRLRRAEKRWEEGPAFQYPDDWPAIEARIRQSSDEGYDVYWCPHVFTKPQRMKEYVTPTLKILWADLDAVDPTKLEELMPSVAWASSSSRYQALWLLSEECPTERVEGVNRALTYYIGADKGGWDVTQVLRVPGSLNHKYDPPEPGRLLWVKRRLFDLAKVDEIVKDVGRSEESAGETLDDLLRGWDVPERALELLYTPEDKVEVGVRSDRLWELEALLVEAGLPIMDIVKIIKLSPWNKFKGRRDEDAQIFREIQKVDAHVKRRAKESSAVTVDESTDKLKQMLWAVPYSVFASKDIPKPEWLINGIWQRGTYGMIAGEPKTYKSVQATDMTLAVASGSAFLGTFDVIRTGAVLFIQEENNEQTVQDRTHKISYAKNMLVDSPLGRALPDDLPVYYSNNYGIDLTSKESRDLIEETIQQIRPVLVVFDPLYMMLGKVDENSAKEVGEVLRWLTYLRNQYGVAILVCHHYNKGGNSTRGGQRVRGSSAFHAWVESALYVKATTTPGQIKVEREFRAFPATEDIAIRLELGEPGEMHYRAYVDSSEDERELSLMKEEILTTLSVSSRTEEELRALTKISRAELRKALKELEMDGFIVKDDHRGRGAKVYYHLSRGGAKVVRDDEDGISL